MKDIAVPISIMLAWIALNVWVLPMFGIRTCMSGTCGTERPAPPVEDSGDKRTSAPDQK